jgi:cytochrome c oxidase subunit III
MASFPTTVPIDAGQRSGNGSAPPSRFGGDEHSSNSAAPDFQTRLRRARVGLAVALSAIAMIFVSFTSAYLVRQGLPTLDTRTGALVHDWVPVPLPPLLLLNTLVLLISSLTIELARRQLVRTNETAEIAAKPNREISWLTLTIVLGLAFLVGQWVAWRELAAGGFYLATSPSSSFVYLLTGFHGIHLLGAVVVLLFAGVATRLRKSIEARLVILDVTGWYWHFMAALWVFIFCLLKFAH